MTDVETDGEEVYAGSADGTVYCLSGKGDLRWAFSCNASVHGLEAYGDLVYAASSDGRFYAINRSTGAAAFSHAPAYEPDGLYNYITTPLSPTIVAAAGKVFFSAAGTLYCLDAQTVERHRGAADSGQDEMLALGAFVIVVLGALGVLLYVVPKRRTA